MFFLWSALHSLMRFRLIIINYFIINLFLFSPFVKISNQRLIGSSSYLLMLWPPCLGSLWEACPLQADLYNKKKPRDWKLVLIDWKPQFVPIENCKRFVIQLKQFNYTNWTWRPEICIFDIEALLLEWKKYQAHVT